MISLKTELVYCIILSFLLLSCGNDNGEQIVYQKVKFQFSPSSEGGRTQVNAQPERVLLTIESKEGEVVLQDETILLASFGNSFVSTPIELPIGQYSLTSFIVIDELNQVMYVAPLEGSVKAYLVAEALPLQFSVAQEEATIVIPEVVPIFTESNPVDYGYTLLGFSVVDIFNLNMAVISDADSSHIPTEISVMGYNSDDEEIVQTIVGTSGTKSIQVDLLSEIEYYTFEVNKTGYHPVHYSFDTDDLVELSDFPIIVSSIEETVAIQISELFKGSNPTPQQIFIYLPIDGCQGSIRIDFGSIKVNSLSIYVEAAHDNGMHVFGELSETLTNGIHQIGSISASENICQTLAAEENIIVSKVLFSTLASRNLEFYTTWNEAMNQWVSVDQVIYSSSSPDPLFHETYDLNN